MDRRLSRITQQHLSGWPVQPDSASAWPTPAPMHRWWRTPEKNTLF